MVNCGIINSSMIDSNQILPMRYLWARHHYKRGVANHWLPESISMQKDSEQWNAPQALTQEERRLVEWNLGFFSTAESLVANNIVLIIYRHVTSPECRQYLLRQAYEGALHTDVVIYCCDSFHLNPEAIYGMYKTIPTIKAKGDFVVELAKPLLNPTFAADDTGSIQGLLRDLFGFYVIMEGIFFYPGFAMMLALKRKNKLVGVGEQFEYMMRDVGLHISFGCDLINTIKAENPGVWTAEFQQQIIEVMKRAVALEQAYIFDVYPKDFLGITTQQLCKYVEYLADLRLERIDLPQQFGCKNPLPWMIHSIDFEKGNEFFDSRVAEYQSAESVDWE